LELVALVQVLLAQTESTLFLALLLLLAVVVVVTAQITQVLVEVLVVVQILHQVEREQQVKDLTVVMEAQRVQVLVVEELVQLVKAIQYLLEAMVFKATLLAHRFIEVAVVGLVGLEKSELVGLVVAELVQ
jgi:hypothetical protein